LRNLLPLDAYHRDESGYWRRMPIVAGTFFGLAMAVGSYFILGNTPNLLHPRSPGEILLIGILSGLFFGALFPLSLRHKLRRFTNRLYSGDEGLIRIPTTEGPFDYKLPCNWLQESVGVGGVLCVGRSGLLFVPHALNRRSATFFRMAPLEQLQVGVSKAPRSLSLLQRMLVPHPPSLLEIRWPSEVACFVVPQATTTADLLIRVLHDLKGRSGQAPDS